MPGLASTPILWTSSHGFRVKPECWISFFFFLLNFIATGGWNVTDLSSFHCSPHASSFIILSSSSFHHPLIYPCIQSFPLCFSSSCSGFMPPYTEKRNLLLSLPSSLIKHVHKTRSHAHVPRFNMTFWGAFSVAQKNAAWLQCLSLSVCCAVLAC